MEEIEYNDDDEIANPQILAEIERKFEELGLAQLGPAFKWELVCQINASVSADIGQVIGRYGVGVYSLRLYEDGKRKTDIGAVIIR